MFKKKKIIFFGGSSFAAQDLVKILNKKYELKNFSRKKIKQINSLYFDLMNESTWKNFFKLKSTNYLIFFSSFVPLDEKNSSLTKCFNVNVYSVVKFLGKINLFIEKIVLASSTSVYGRYSGKKIDEKFNSLPENNYSLSKYLQENIFRIYCEQKKYKFLCLRLGYVYGKNLRKKRLLNKIISLIKKDKKFKVYNQNKIQLNLIHTRDIGLIVDKILKKGDGTFNLTNYKFINLKEFINMVYKKLHKKKNYKNINIKSFKPQNFFLSKKLYKSHNLKNKIPITEGIKDLL